MIRQNKSIEALKHGITYFLDDKESGLSHKPLNIPSEYRDNHTYREPLGTVITPAKYANLSIALQAYEKGYNDLQYLTFDDIKKDNLFLKKGAKSIPIEGFFLSLNREQFNNDKKYFEVLKEIADIKNPNIVYNDMYNIRCKGIIKEALENNNLKFDFRTKQYNLFNIEEIANRKKETYNVELVEELSKNNVLNSYITQMTDAYNSYNFHIFEDDSISKLDDKEIMEFLKDYLESNNEISKEWDEPDKDNLFSKKFSLLLLASTLSINNEETRKLAAELNKDWKEILQDSRSNQMDASIRVRNIAKNAYDYLPNLTDIENSKRLFKQIADKTDLYKEVVKDFNEKSPIPCHLYVGRYSKQGTNDKFGIDIGFDPALTYNIKMNSGLDRAIPSTKEEICTKAFFRFNHVIDWVHNINNNKYIDISHTKLATVDYEKLEEFKNYLLSQSSVKGIYEACKQNDNIDISFNDNTNEINIRTVNLYKEVNPTQSLQFDELQNDKIYQSSNGHTYSTVMTWIEPIYEDFVQTKHYILDGELYYGKDSESTDNYRKREFEAGIIKDYDTAMKNLNEMFKNETFHEVEKLKSIEVNVSILGHTESEISRMISKSLKESAHLNQENESIYKEVIDKFENDLSSIQDDKIQAENFGINKDDYEICF